MMKMLINLDEDKIISEGKYDINKIKDYLNKSFAKSGDVLIMDFGPWNSYPLWMMQMIADKPTVTYVFKYTYQGNKYEVTINPGDKFALDCDWYGPLKMPTLFDTVITKW